MREGRDNRDRDRDMYGHNHHRGDRDSYDSGNNNNNNNRDSSWDHSNSRDYHHSGRDHSNSRDYQRDDNRQRRRERDMDDDHSQSREWSRGREREHFTEHDQDYYGYENEERDMGEGDYDGYSNERYGQRNDRRDREKEPSASVMLRGLKPTTTIEMITDCLKPFGAVNAVRLIRNKQTGEPRGFAFVDFMTIDDAMNLMAHQNKTLFIDGRTVQLDYSTTPAPPPPSSGGGVFKDWICPQCQATNFARRTSCYICNLAKPANPTLAPQAEDLPSSSLIVKGLTVNTTEESIRAALSTFAQVKDVRLARDKNTGLSRCFAFVEFFSVDDATYVLGAAVNYPIDGNPIRLFYARNMDSGHNNPHRSQNQQHHSAASEQAAWMAYNQKYGNQQAGQNQGYSQPGGEGYIYDSTSGFYYNASTGYYYDDQTKKYMYYDEKLQQYMNYDQATNSYTPYVPPSSVAPPPTIPTVPPSTPVASTPAIPTPSTTTTDTTTTTTTTQSQPTKPTISAPPSISKPPKPAPSGPVKMTLKEAKPKKTLNNSSVPGIFAKKKISQEVARWNQKGKELSEEPTPIPAPAPVTSTANTTPIQQKPTPSVSSHTISALPTIPTPSIPSTLPPPPSEQEPSKPICLLCKRQFKTMEQLHKHETLSDLHKTNLELAKQKQLLAKEEHLEESGQKRAREDWNEPKREINEKDDYSNKSRKTDTGGGVLGASSWQGGGLGKAGDGMVAPIEVTLRAERAGLGADDDEKYAVTPGDSYKEATRKKALSRFEAITNINVAEVNANHPFLKKRG